jgi:hypothetical protein
VIVKSSDDGCGEYNISRVCGLVELDKTWELSKNKDSIVVGANELYDEVERVCLPVLRRADNASMTVETAAFENEVSQLLQSALEAPDGENGDDTEKGRRNRGTTRGTKSPTGRGGKHRQARNRQSGQTFPEVSRPGGSVRVIHSYMSGTPVLGKFKGNVYLNRNIVLVEKAYRERNVIATAALAFGLIANEMAIHGVKPQLKIRGLEEASSQVETYRRAMGSLLSSEIAVDGRAGLRSVK